MQNHNIMDFSFSLLSEHANSLVSSIKSIIT
jgi:hypothetical protein